MDLKVSNLYVPACRGLMTLHNSLHLFEGNGTDHVKNKNLKVSGPPTPGTNFNLVEYQNSLELPRLLGDPTRFEMTQHQIAVFCKLHRDKLRTTGFGTHFVFRNQGKWYVLRVRVMFGLLYLLDYYLYNKAQSPFHRNTVWICQPE